MRCGRGESLIVPFTFSYQGPHSVGAFRQESMRSFTTAVALALAVAALGACTDAAVSRGLTTSEAETPGAAARVASPAPTDSPGVIAHSFALALARPDVRAAVRDAMRGSRVTEHKLVLQEFVGTPEGRLLVAAAAQATGTTSEAVLSRVRALPLMDFYAPYREHRNRWRATADVRVGAALNPEKSAMILYATNGHAVELREPDGVPSRPVLFLIPAERKSLRIDAQPDRPGAVIQDEGDGELSGTLEWVGRDGRVQSVPLAHLSYRNLRPGRASMDVVGGGGCSTIDVDTPCLDQGAGGTSSAPVDTTRLEFFQTNVRDAFSTNAELEFRAAYHASGQVIDSRTLRIEGVEYNKAYYYDDLALIFRRIPDQSTDYIRINIVETDPLDDDDLGSRNFYFTDRFATRSIIDNGSFIEGQTVVNLMIRWTLRNP